MENNLDKIAKDLYGKIQTRFPDIKIGDENAEVLSKKSDIPKARFFEFEYTEHGKPLGTIAITLDTDDGIVIQISGELGDVKSTYHKAYAFIRSFRKFAKSRLLNFDVQNIGKSNLDKRDYQFQAKSKELPIMENKMFGTNRISYQNLGEARLIVKHSQPINPAVAAGRSMHIESIYIENADGERFKYPYKHLHGARALAEHIKHGGNPYDAIGKHITGLSEELNQLRKFKGYVSRQEQVSEAMGSVTNRVLERIESVKKEVQNLQKASYYEQFAESFVEQTEKIIPEEIMNDWVDRLTVRTFNEELKSVFPYLYNIVDETQLPVKELDADDLLDEAFGKKGLEARLKKHGFGDSEYWEKAKKEKEERHSKADSEMAQRELDWKEKFGKKDESFDPELAFESFIENIVNEDKNELLSTEPLTRNRAINKFNSMLSSKLSGGMPGVLALKGLLDDPEITSKIEVLDDDIKIRREIEEYLLDKEPKLIPLLPELSNTKADAIGGEPAPIPEPAPAPAPDEAPEPAPAPMPVAESSDKNIKMKAKFIKVKEAGATLDTPFAEGMTIRDAMEECGINPAECGYEEEQEIVSDENGIEQLLKTIAGFWNKEEKNFTIGGERAKIKVVKAFKDGECPNASEEDVKRVLLMIDKKDPSHSTEQDNVLHLAGVKKSEPEIVIVQHDNREDNLLNNIKVMQEEPLLEGLNQLKRNAGLL